VEQPDQVVRGHARKHAHGEHKVTSSDDSSTLEKNFLLRFILRTAHDLSLVQFNTPHQVQTSLLFIHPAASSQFRPFDGNSIIRAYRSRIKSGPRFKSKKIALQPDRCRRYFFFDKLPKACPCSVPVQKDVPSVHEDKMPFTKAAKISRSKWAWTSVSSWVEGRRRRSTWTAGAIEGDRTGLGAGSLSSVVE
jgi:hypothetical protein